MLNHDKRCDCSGCVEERGTLNLKRAKERMERTLRKLAAQPDRKSAPLPRVRKIETFAPKARKPAPELTMPAAQVGAAKPSEGKVNKSGILLAQFSCGVATVSLAVSYTGHVAPTVALFGLSVAIGLTALVVTWRNLGRFK